LHQATNHGSGGEMLDGLLVPLQAGTDRVVDSPIFVSCARNTAWLPRRPGHYRLRVVSLSGGKNVCTLPGILCLPRDREQDHLDRTETIFAVLRNPDLQRLTRVSRFNFTAPGCNT